MKLSTKYIQYVVTFSRILIEYHNRNIIVQDTITYIALELFNKCLIE